MAKQKAGQGSWLDVADVGLGLSLQCRARRIENVHNLRRKASMSGTRRDAAAVNVNGQFITAYARIELRRLYPSIDN